MFTPLQPCVLPADAEQEREEGYSFAEATQGWSGDDVVTLMRVYAAIVAAAKAGMQHFATEVGGSAVASEGCAAFQGDVGGERCATPLPARDAAALDHGGARFGASLAMQLQQGPVKA